MAETTTMEPGKHYVIRPKGRASPGVQKKLRNLGSVALCIRVVEESAVYPGRGPCAEVAAGDDGYEAETQPGRWKNWIPLAEVTFELVEVGTPDAMADALDLEQTADRLRVLGRRHAADVLEIGLLLTGVKEQLKHGEFLPWCQKNLPGWSKPSIARYMQASAVFGDQKSLAETFELSALYLLASGRAPEEARTRALAMARKGQPVTRAEAFAMVRALRGHEDPDPDSQWRRLVRGASTMVEQLRALGVPAAMVAEAERLAKKVDTYRAKVVDAAPTATVQ